MGTIESDLFRQRISTLVRTVTYRHSILSSSALFIITGIGYTIYSEISNVRIKGNGTYLSPNCNKYCHSREGGNPLRSARNDSAIFLR